MRGKKVGEQPAGRPLVRRGASSQLQYMYFLQCEVVRRPIYLQPALEVGASRLRHRRRGRHAVRMVRRDGRCERCGCAGTLVSGRERRSPRLRLRTASGVPRRMLRPVLRLRRSRGIEHQLAIIAAVIINTGTMDTVNMPYHLTHPRTVRRSSLIIVPQALLTNSGRWVCRQVGRHIYI